MFTGIIREIGTVASVRRADGVVVLAILAPRTAGLSRPMESVAVNGVCLTVAGVDGEILEFEAIPETLRLTSLGRLAGGSPVNLEPSLAVGERFHGHVVLGHIDGTGTIVERRQMRGQLVVSIRLSQQLFRLLVPKGPVTVDGISLTVGQRLSRGVFQVYLIPETLRRTTLGHRAVRDPVNIELDYFAKLQAQLLAHRTRRSGRSG